MHLENISYILTYVLKIEKLIQILLCMLLDLETQRDTALHNAKITGLILYSGNTNKLWIFNALCGLQNVYQDT